METQYLREFVVLSECLSFTETAYRIGTTQSTVSKHIGKIEKNLGVRLVSRAHGEIRLTEEGERLLPHARAILEECYSAVQSVSGKEAEGTKSFTLGVLHNPQYYNLFRYVNGFRKLDPGYQINIIEGSEQDLFAMAEDHRINMFTSYKPPKDMKWLSYITVIRANLSVTMREDDPLASKRTITLGDLAGRKLLLPQRGSTLWGIILGEFRRSGIEPDVVYEGSSASVFDLVRENIGIGLQFTQMFENESRKGLRVIEIAPAIPYDCGLSYRNDCELTEVEKTYIEYIRKNFGI